MKVSQDDLAMLAAIAGNFPKLREFLKARFDGYVNTMVLSTDDATMRRAQGRAAELDDLIKVLDQAKDALMRSRAAR